MDIATLILSGALMLLIGIPLIVAFVLVWQLIRTAWRLRRREPAEQMAANPDDEW